MLAVLDYGIGNLHSAHKALRRVGGDARLVRTVEEAEGASGLVLPGVGAFGACMSALRAAGLDQVVHEGIAAGTPFLGICVGMQMLYEGSEEDPAVPGLGILPGRLAMLPTSVKRPQMQWNILDLVRPEDPLLADLDLEPWVYFVHSYAAEVSEGAIATCDYGGPLVAVVARDNLWATQFHPEKSGPVGLQLLRNFVEIVEAASIIGASS